MNTSVEQIDDNTVRLIVTIPASDVDAAVDRAYRELGKQVKIPGFRPGKVPREMIDANLGPDSVVAQAQENLLAESYPVAVDAEEIRPIANPDMDELAQVVPGEEFTYTAEVQVKPEPKLSSADDLQVILPPNEASEEEVDTQIEQMRDQFASLEPVEGRGVAEGDFALLSFVGTVEGEPYEGNTVDKYLYEMGKGLMPPEFDEGIIGVEAGGETRAEFVIPETSSKPELVGKPAAFDITVHEIKAKVLPELDDEFASSAGGFETMEELRAAVKQNLDEAKVNGRKRMLEREARAAVADRLEGEIPEPMIVTKRDSMLDKFFGDMKMQGMDVEKFASSSPEEFKGLLEEMQAQAAIVVREELALEALFRAKDMEVTEEDISAEIDRWAEAAEITVEELRERMEGTRAIEMITEHIMQRKALEWLTDESNVKVIEEKDADFGDLGFGEVEKTSAQSAEGSTSEAAEEPVGDAAEDSVDEAAGESDEE